MDERTSKSAVGANDPAFSERTPIYIPVIHAQVDMGALSETIQRLKVKKPGRKGWERYVRPVNKLWTRVEQAIQSLVLHCERRLVRQARYYWLRLAQGHLNRQRFRAMLERIALLPAPRR
ncbi:MAG: hypothetical protein ABSG91_21080 [Syntrophobacteraceae bacterium]|jgi:hypothetical protein